MYDDNNYEQTLELIDTTTAYALTGAMYVILARQILSLHLMSFV